MFISLVRHILRCQYLSETIEFWKKINKLAKHRDKPAIEKNPVTKSCLETMKNSLILAAQELSFC